MPDRVERVVRAADERLQPQRVHRGRPLDERDGDRVRAGLERHAERRALLDVVARLRHVLEVGLEVVVAADRRQMHALAVDGEFELMVVFEPAHDAQVRAEQPDREGVLAVERQRRLRENAADGADRQPFDVRVLRRVLADAERLPRRLRFGIADRQRGDLVGRRQIALEQHGRDAERVRDVVEPVRRIVGRQHRRRVDVEREQIAESRSRIRRDSAGESGRARDSASRAPRDRARSSGTTRARAPSPGRAAAPLRRHHADAHLADDFFQDVSVGGNVGQVDLVQRQAGGLRALVVTGDAVFIEDRAGISGGLAAMDVGELCWTLGVAWGGAAAWGTAHRADDIQISTATGTHTRLFIKALPSRTASREGTRDC